jgi:hypothetical protein
MASSTVRSFLEESQICQEGINRDLYTFEAVVVRELFHERHALLSFHRFRAVRMEEMMRCAV